MSEYYLDDEVYQSVLELLNNQHFVENKGNDSDLTFLSDDWWLRDTAVSERIVKRNGMWEIHLVFAHYLHPNQLITRVISKHTDKCKAELNAWYMKRLAAKDQRGTLKINIEDFGLCFS